MYLENEFLRQEILVRAMLVKTSCFRLRSNLNIIPCWLHLSGDGSLVEWTRGLAGVVTVHYVTVRYFELDTGIVRYFSEIRKTRQSLWWGKLARLT